MRKYLLPAAALIVLAAAFIAIRMMQASPPAGDPAREKPTEAGHFIVAIAPRDTPFVRARLHGWFVTVTTPDGAPVRGAAITVGGGMAQHGHGLPTEPAVSGEVEPGRYLVEGVRFHMPGRWQFSFDIAAGDLRDRVSFDLDL